MPCRLIAAPFLRHDGGLQEGRDAVADPEHVKRLRQTVEVWKTWRGRAGMLLTASLRRAKAIPKIAAWVRTVAVIIAAAAVLELLFAIWRRWGRSASTELIIAVGLALAPLLAYGAWWLWWRLPKRQVDRLALPTTKESADVEDNFRKTVGQALGGAAVLIGAGFALFQFLQQQQAAQDLLISNQVSKGFEQLAGNKIEMRLGGIYALEGVMNDKTSPQYHQPVLEALCAFVRGHADLKDKTATDVQAALTVIGRRVKGTGAVNLANVNIPGADLGRADLAGAHLEDADLAGAHLEDANLSGANLVRANLTSALVRANLTRADLRDANLSGTDLFGANLSGADLERANLTSAVLIGVNLTRAYLSGANLSGADLRDANLRGAFLNKDMSKENRAFLSGANLSGADLRGANRVRSKVMHSRCGFA
jgi:uncharacterized protein YjbI with pentapeptide repeats